MAISKSVRDFVGTRHVGDPGLATIFYISPQTCLVWIVQEAVGNKFADFHSVCDDANLIILIDVRNGFADFFVDFLNNFRGEVLRGEDFINSYRQAFCAVVYQTFLQPWFANHVHVFRLVILEIFL